MVIKVNAIDTKTSSTNRLVTKTQCNLYEQGLEKKIEDVPNTSGLVKKTDYNTKITEIENKMPSVISLATIAALNAKSTEIENKIPDITNLATKAVYKTKVQMLNVKYLTLRIQPDRLLSIQKPQRSKTNIPYHRGYYYP